MREPNAGEHHLLNQTSAAFKNNRIAEFAVFLKMKAEASAYGTFAHSDIDDEFAPSGCDMAPESAFAAYTTRPAPKFDPSWWWNSIRGAEWFHLYLWMLKDLLWCPHCPIC
jgi:hypothetical protein